MNQKNPSIKERLVRVETKLDELQETFDRFVANDFKHFRNKVEEVNDKLLWGFIVGIGMLIIAQIILKFFRF